MTVPSGLSAGISGSFGGGLFNRCCRRCGVENAAPERFVNTVNGYRALATVIASAAMFLLFQNIRIRSDYWRRWVFRLAPLSFGVYLHDSDFTGRCCGGGRPALVRWALLPSLAYLTGAVLLIAVAGARWMPCISGLRCCACPHWKTKLDALTACILQRSSGGKVKKALSHEFFV